MTILAALTAAGPISDYLSLSGGPLSKVFLRRNGDEYCYQVKQQIPAKKAALAYEKGFTVNS
jgi:hypothetical protein